MNRRETLKWIVAASAAVPSLDSRALALRADAPAAVPTHATGFATGYGTDPDLMRPHRPGDVWPLSLSAAERRTAGALCDLIIPADEHSPSASQAGLVEFLDEWLSAPYPRQREDYTRITAGLAWLDGEADRGFGTSFAALNEGQQTAIADEICYVPAAAPASAAAAEFFARFRDLTAGGFYSTAAGRADLQYRGNQPAAQFDPPTTDVLRALGLMEET